MSDYTKNTDFAAKDALASGDPNKIIKGLDFGTEFDNLEVAVNSKADSVDATLTGTTSFENLSDGTTTATGFSTDGTLASNSDSLIPTQQAVKSYVDSAAAFSLVSDTAPELGGDLDLSSNNIIGTGNVNITGDVALSGTVDGRDVAADGTKLDGIEAGATGDQTATEIKALVDAALDSNVFTDAEKTKLTGIEANADVTDAVNVEAAGALMDSEIVNLDQVKAFDTDEYATAAQGLTADSALQSISDDSLPQLGADLDVNGHSITSSLSGNINITPSGTGSLVLDGLTWPSADGSSGQVIGTDGAGNLSFVDGGTGGGGAVDSVNGATGVVVLDADDIDDTTTTHKFTTDADITKLAGIESGATGDMSGAEIKTAYESQANTNAYTDAELLKLGGIEANATADQTAAEIRTLVDSATDSNVFTDAEQTKLAGISAGAEANTVDSVNTQTGAVVLDADDIDDTATTNKFTTAGDITKLAGIESGATADQTGAEIKAAYEGESDTNAFTDAEKTKLSGIEAGATGDMSGSEIKTAYESQANTNAYTDAELLKLGGIEANATADQTGAEIKAAYEGEADTNAYTDAEKTKLSGIETNATADQTGAEIKAAYEGEADTNAFTDAEQTKLAGIEAGATGDQTAAEIRTLVESATDSNVFTDADHTKLDGLASSSVTYLNVLDFGVIGDGAQDETDEIQSAINHAAKNDIGTVFFPDGHYVFTKLYFNYRSSYQVASGTTQSTFAYEFEADNAADLEVKVNGSVTTAFTITGAGNVAGGTITLTTAATSGQKVIISSLSRRSGRIRLLGCGSLNVSNLRRIESNGTSMTSETKAKLYGTVLDSTGDGLILAGEDDAALGGIPSRKWEAEHITFIGNNAGGAVITAFSCPDMSLSYCCVKQLALNGNGIIARSSWFFNLDRCFVFGPTDTGINNVGPISSATGTGIIGGTYTLAGEWTIKNSLIDTWRDCISFVEGEFVNVALHDSTVQNSLRYGIYVQDGTIRQLYLNNAYFENTKKVGVNYIKSDTDALRNLNVKNNFFLTGFRSSGVAGKYLSGACIDLAEIDTVKLDGNYVFRPVGTFLNVTAPRSNQSDIGLAENNTFFFDLKSSTDFTALDQSIDLFTGILPRLERNQWSDMENGLFQTVPTNTADTLYREYDPDITVGPPAHIDGRNAVHSLGSIGYGRLGGATSVNSTTTIDEDDIGTFFSFQMGSTRALFLPDGNRVPEGRIYVIQNDATSSGDIGVRNFSEQFTGDTLGTVKAGKTMTFIKGAGSSGYFALEAPDPDVSALLPKAGGTMTGELQVNARLDVGNGSGVDHEIRISKGGNSTSDHLQFFHNTTAVGEIGCHDTTWLRINQHTEKNIYTPRFIRADGGFFVDGEVKGINGFGNFVGGTITNASDANVADWDTAFGWGDHAAAGYATTTYTHPTYTTRSINTSGAQVLDVLTTDSIGSVTNATTRTMTLADLGYTGATNANNYSLPIATATVRGGIELFSNTDQSVAANAVTATAGRTYGVQLNSTNQAVVNVPWTDTNTTYSAGTNLTLSGTTFNMATGGVGAGTYGSTANGVKIDTITVDAYGRVTAVATGTCGDILGVTAGTGLSGGGTAGTVTLNVDLSELTDMTQTMVSSDEFIVLDNGNDRRKRAAEIGLSVFNNDAGFTSNSGDITGVTAGDGLSGGATSGNASLAVDSTVARTSGDTFTGNLEVSNALLTCTRNNNNLQLNRTSTQGKITRYMYNGTEVGYVSVTGSATSYNTSSDERLKENIVDAPSASDDIDAIKVRSFDWKADGTHQKYGMIAQELQEVAPASVNADESEDEMLGVDFSTLVPMMVKEIQELRARVAELEGK
jgi:hypothetical protein